MSKGSLVAAGLMLVPLIAIIILDRTRSEIVDVVTPLPSPAGVESSGPNLTGSSNGSIYLSWLEPSGSDGHVLRFSALARKVGWSPPETIAGGSGWFVNAADVPSLLALSDGSLVAHWLVETGTFRDEAYNVRISTSRDRGKTWSEPFTPYRDQSKSQHGFVSMFPTLDRRLGLVWLDGRKLGPEIEDMALMVASIGLDGSGGEETELDGRVCDCCQTSVATVPEGLIAVYRDRSADEVRDIAILRYEAGRWSQPRILAADNWKIDVCPVNGPAISAQARNVVVAWFTEADGQPLVKAVFSDDAGKTFGKPVRLNEGNTLGRVSAAMLPSGDAMISWVDLDDKSAHIRVRRVKLDGSMGPVVNVAETSLSISSGFPRMARSGNEVVIAWTETGEQSRVRTALVSGE